MQIKEDEGNGAEWWGIGGDGEDEVEEAARVKLHYACLLNIYPLRVVSSYRTHWFEHSISAGWYGVVVAVVVGVVVGVVTEHVPNSPAENASAIWFSVLAVAPHSPRTKITPPNAQPRLGRGVQHASVCRACSVKPNERGYTATRYNGWILKLVIGCHPGYRDR